MRRMLIVLVVLVGLVVPVGVWAQEEGVTLEGLAERVMGLDGRVEALERLYKPAAVMDDEGNCQLAVGEVDFMDGDGGMHPTSVATYLVLSDGLVPESVSIRSVSFTPEGLVAVRLQVYDRPDTGRLQEYGTHVIEYWDGCEFQFHSSFWEEDHRGNVTYLAVPE